MGQAHDDGVRSVDIRVSPASLPWVVWWVWEGCVSDVLPCVSSCPSLIITRRVITSHQTIWATVSIRWYSAECDQVWCDPLTSNIISRQQHLHWLKNHSQCPQQKSCSLYISKNPRGQFPSMIEDCSIISVLIVFFVCHDCNVQTNQQISEFTQHCNIVVFDMSVPHLCHHWELIEDKT